MAQLRRKVVYVMKEKCEWHQERKQWRSKVELAEKRLNDVELNSECQVDSLKREKKAAMIESQSRMIKQQTQLEEKNGQLELKEEEIQQELQLCANLKESFRGRELSWERRLSEREQLFADERRTAKQLLMSEASKALELESELQAVRALSSQYKETCRQKHMELEEKHQNEISSLENNLRKKFEAQLETKLEKQKLQFEADKQRRFAAQGKSSSSRGVGMMSATSGICNDICTTVNICSNDTFISGQSGKSSEFLSGANQIQMDHAVAVRKLQLEVDVMGAKLARVELEKDQLQDQRRFLKEKTEESDLVVSTLKDVEKRVTAAMESFNNPMVQFQQSNAQNTLIGQGVSNPDAKSLAQEVAQGFTILADLKKQFSSITVPSSQKSSLEDRTLSENVAQRPHEDTQDGEVEETQENRKLENLPRKLENCQGSEIGDLPQSQSEPPADESGETSGNSELQLVASLRASPSPVRRAQLLSQDVDKRTGVEGNSVAGHGQFAPQAKKEILQQRKRLNGFTPSPGFTNWRVSARAPGGGMFSNFGVSVRGPGNVLQCTDGDAIYCDSARDLATPSPPESERQSQSSLRNNILQPICMNKPNGILAEKTRNGIFAEPPLVKIVPPFVATNQLKSSGGDVYAN